MTRKTYVHKLWNLTLAIYRDPESNFMEGYKVGNAFRHNKDFAKNVPEKFGSYEAAWNSETMVMCRKRYGVS